MSERERVGYYTDTELTQLGLGACGQDVLLSRRASLYGPEDIRIGNHVRIDDFCLLSGRGGINIGDYVHLGAFCGLFGTGCVTLADFANLSARVSIFSSSDDFSGAHMSNPMVPTEFTCVTVSAVTIGKHVILGAGAVVLPGVDVPDGCAVGAQSLVKRDLEPWSIYAGAPARLLGERSTALLSDEARLSARDTGVR